jgi:predicted permease
MGQDLRFALRSILAHPWFSAAIVVTVAMGIGVNTMVFTLVNAVLLKPLAVPHGERIVVLSNSNLLHSDDSMRISYPDFLDYRAQVTSAESMQAASDEQGVLSERGNPPAPYHLEHATAGLFDMLHVRPILGRGFLSTDDQPGAAPVLLLGYGAWKDRYGSSPSVIGHSVRVNDAQATIIGVMPEGFKFPVETDLWMPLVPTADLEKRDSHPLEVWAMLKPGVRIEQASVEGNQIASRLAQQYPEADKNRGLRVQTFNRRYNGSNIRTVFLLMLAAVGFVLLIACANVANMMLTRALRRQREMSIRAALGATRWRVMREQFTESLILSALGGSLGLGFAALGVRWFDLSTQNVGKPYWIQFTMDWKVFAYFAALCIASGLLFGMAPAWRASHVNLMEVMKEGARSMGKQRGGKLAAAMVIFQFALTLVLLTGAGIFVHNLLLMLTANRGVPSDQLLTAHIDLPDSRYKDTDAKQHFFDQLLPRLRALPGVTHVAAASHLPGLGSGQRDIEIEHSSVEVKSSRPRVAMVVESPGYFDAIHLPLLLGRDFNETDGTDGHKAAILTRQCAARFWPNQDAIGKRFRFFDDNNKPEDWITVIGVSADMVQDMNDKNPQPLLFLPFRQEGWGGMNLFIESRLDVTGGLRAAVSSIDEDLPLRDVSILNKEIEHREWFFVLLTQMFTGFALIALLMASVGIYAVIAHATGSRTQEIGVRMALGADTHNILMLVMKRGLWQIAAGLALGLCAAFPVARIMASLPLGVSPSDPGVFAAVASVLVAVGLFACWLPARKAAALDPVKAIRVE